MTSKGGGGVGIPMILFIVFLVLKLVDKIDWSWWWVTSPLWIPMGLGLLCFFVMFCIGITVATLASNHINTTTRKNLHR